MRTEQPEMFPGGPPSRRNRRTELAVKRDLRGLRRAAALEERAGLAAALEVLARSVDRADAASDTWAAAAAAREIRQIYALLGPGGPADDLDRFLAELSAPLGHDSDA